MHPSVGVIFPQSTGEIEKRISVIVMGSINRKLQVFEEEKVISSTLRNQIDGHFHRLWKVDEESGKYENGNFPYWLKLPFSSGKYKINKQEFRLNVMEPIETFFGTRKSIVLRGSWKYRILHFNYVDSYLRWYDEETGVLLKLVRILKIRSNRDFESEHHIEEVTELVQVTNLPRLTTAMAPRIFPLMSNKKELLSALLKMDESSNLEFKSSLIHPFDEQKELAALQQLLEERSGELRRLRDDDIERVREINKERLQLEQQIFNAQKQQKEALRFSVLKTICAFLNSEGGNIIIGYHQNSSKIVGIEKDFEYLERKNTDGWLQYMTDLIAERIGVNAKHYLDIQAIDSEGKTVILIQTKPSDEPFYLDKNGKKLLYTRFANTSRPVPDSELDSYIKKRWKNGG